MGERVYGWDGGDGEYVGDFATPEEAAEDVWMGTAKPGATVRVGFGTPVDPLLLLAHGMPLADTVIEAIGEYAVDDVGLCAEGFPAGVSAAMSDLSRKLRAAIVCWGREHGVRAPFWRLEGTVLLTMTADGWVRGEEERYG